MSSFDPVSFAIGKKAVTNGRSKSVSGTATGVVYTINRLLGSSSTLSLVSGTNSNLTLSGANISATAGIGAGSSQKAIVREVSGDSAVEYPVTISGTYVLSVPSTATVNTSAASGTTVVNITGVPSGVTPTVSPNDGRVVVGGSEGAGWKLVRGLTAVSAGVTSYTVSATGATSATVAVTFSDAVATWLVAANRGESMSDSVGGTPTNTRHVQRTKHYMGKAPNGYSSWRPVMGNYLVNGTNSETSAGNTITYQMAMEIPGAPTPVVRLTAGGSNSMTLLVGTEQAFDAVAPSAFGLSSFDPATVFYYRAIIDHVSNATRVGNGEVGTGTPAGEAVYYCPPANADSEQLMNSGALVAGTMAAGSMLHMPVRSEGLAVDHDMAVCLLGTSIMQGNADNQVSGSPVGVPVGGRGGAFRRSLEAAGVPYCSTARAGSQVSNYRTGANLRRNNYAVCTHFIDEYSTNDFASNRTSVQVTGDLSAEHTVIRAARPDAWIWQTTCLPRCDGGGSVSPTDPSTMVPGLRFSNSATGYRPDFNTLLRGGSGLATVNADAIIDTSATVEWATSADRFDVDAGPVALTDTGYIHPSTAGSLRMKAAVDTAVAARLSLISRAA